MSIKINFMIRFGMKLTTLMSLNVLLLGLFGAIGRAESPQVEFMRSFQSEQVSFPSNSSDYAQRTPGQDPDWMRWFFQDFMAWNPTGKPAFFTTQCKPGLWAEKLINKKVQAQAAILNEYLTKCQTELETGVHQSWIHSLKIMSVQLDLENHPLIHRVVFNLPNGDRVKGRLALKGDLKKRPLVIFRLGVFANIEEFKPERFIFMMLFEQAPFNVLVLENNSGPDSLFFNHRLAVGGFDEGLQNTWIARQLTDPREPLSQIIDSVHLTAMSLGGHGMFYSSLLNQYNQTVQGQKIFSSFMGFCPVVYLQKAFDHLNEPGLFGMTVESWSRFRLQVVKSKDPNLTTWDFKDAFLLRPTFLKKVMAKAEQDFKIDSVSKLKMKLPPGQKSQKAFWDLENFWPSYHRVKSPVLVWGTSNDLLVPLPDHSQTLHEENIGLVKFSQGYHCTLPIGYDWSMLSTLMSGYFLSHSVGHFEQKTELQKIEFSKDYDTLAENWLVDQIEWLDLNPHDVNLHLLNQKNKSQTVNVLLALDRLDFRLRNPQISDSEKRMLERWIFQNVKPVNQNHDSALWLQWKRAL